MLRIFRMQGWSGSSSGWSSLSELDLLMLTLLRELRCEISVPKATKFLILAAHVCKKVDVRKFLRKISQQWERISQWRRGLSRDSMQTFLFLLLKDRRYLLQGIKVKNKNTSHLGRE